MSLHSVRHVGRDRTLTSSKPTLVPVDVLASCGTGVEASSLRGKVSARVTLWQCIAGPKRSDIHECIGLNEAETSGSSAVAQARVG